MNNVFEINMFEKDFASQGDLKILDNHQVKATLDKSASGYNSAALSSNRLISEKEVILKSLVLEQYRYSTRRPDDVVSIEYFSRNKVEIRYRFDYRNTELLFPRGLIGNYFELEEEDFEEQDEWGEYFGWNEIYYSPTDRLKLVNAQRMNCLSFFVRHGFIGHYTTHSTSKQERFNNSLSCLYYLPNDEIVEFDPIYFDLKLELELGPNYFSVDHGCNNLTRIKNHSTYCRYLSVVCDVQQATEILQGLGLGSIKLPF
jgi:hypothetical protein